MKPPAASGTSTSGVVKKVLGVISGLSGRIQGLSSGLLALVRKKLPARKAQALERVPDSDDLPEPDALAETVHDDRFRRFALVTVVVALGLSGVISGGLVIASIGGKKQGKATGPGAESGSFSASIPGPTNRIPGPGLKGTDLASMLLVPPALDALPLARAPRSGYTEADVRDMYPDLENVDSTGLERQRKAELEAVYNAVD